MIHEETGLAMTDVPTEGKLRAIWNRDTMHATNRRKAEPSAISERLRHEERLAILATAYVVQTG